MKYTCVRSNSCQRRPPPALWLDAFKLFSTLTTLVPNRRTANGSGTDLERYSIDGWWWHGSSPLDIGGAGDLEPTDEADSP